MVKRNSSDIDMLLSILLLSSALIGGLHHWSLGAQQKNDAKKATNAKSAEAKETQPQTAESQAAEPKKEATPRETPQEKIPNPLADATAAEVFTEVQPLVQSESVEKTIKMLDGVPLKTVMAVLGKILENQQLNLKRDDRVELLVGVAATYKNEKDQYQVLDLILDPKYLYLRKGAPILYIAAYGDYPQIIPTIKTWYANRVAQQANHAELCEELETRALTYAVENQKVDELKAMMDHGMKMDKNRMSALLVDAIERKTGCPVIEFLLKQGADINYVAKGYTPLLKAIINNDFAAVKFLVDHGADVNKIGDNKIGNARQVAGEAVEKASQDLKKGGKKKKVSAERNAVAIEAYLIKHGAGS